MTKLPTNRVLILSTCIALVILSFQSDLTWMGSGLTGQLRGERHPTTRERRANDSVEHFGFNFSSRSDGNMTVVTMEGINAKGQHKKMRFDIDTEKGNVFRFPKQVGRDVLGGIAENLGLRSGVEVGVQRGLFAVDILSIWESCQEYVLVDLWAHQDNYIDLANKDQSEQEVIMTTALENVKPWKDITETCRNYSELCAEKYSSGHFDYAYIDARHDFKGVFADLEAWYPKVRSGGIMAGHDYLDSYTVWRMSKQNWTVQFDGSLDYGRESVKGAVNLFFALNKQYVTVTNWKEPYPSWVMRKTEGERQTNEILHFINLSCFDGSECELVPVQIGLTVREWETLNGDFTSIIWTTELVKKYFPEESTAFDISYHGNIAAFEDMMKLVILHRFGGTFIDPSIKPVQSLDRFIKQAQELGRPFAFCSKGSGNGGDHAIDPAECESISTLVIGSKAEDKQLSRMRKEHEKQFSEGWSSKSMDDEKVFEEVLKRADVTVFQMNIGFPCEGEVEKGFSEECVAVRSG